MTADKDELVDRLLGRAQKKGRSDDNEAVISRRLDLYHEQTEAVVNQYARRGILTKVHGTGSVSEVTERVLRSLGSMVGTI